MKWFFEPGHTAAEFRARHMMVTWVRGAFKNVHGKLEFDPAHPADLAVDVTIDARTCSTGEPARDEHLKSADFLHCDQYPNIRYSGRGARVVGPNDYEVDGSLTIRDVTRTVTLSVRYLGSAETSWWEDGVDKGPKTRAGFVARARIDRFDFGVSWNAQLANGGLVVSRGIDIVIDAEAIAENC
ncbi:MAG: polyisoprenoid-binding protein [Candidatus Eremiobacteraeota bacterium]|nr:polyisoprenoid-binding protein [Candidatus Eremiobacteraeota bacterium]